MPNYATKSDLKNATDVDASNLQKKADLASSESHLDKLDIDKLGTPLVDLSRLSNVMKMMLLKRLHIMNRLKS